MLGAKHIVGCILIVLAVGGCEEGRPRVDKKDFQPVSSTPPTQVQEVCEVEPQPWLAASLPRRLTQYEYRAAIQSVFGVALEDTVAFPPDEESMGFTNNARALQASPTHIERYFQASEVVGQLAVPFMEPLLSCDLVDIDEACLRAWVYRIGRRAWRRSLVPEEAESLVSLAYAQSEEVAPRQQLASVIEAMVQSPWFLYRVEVGEPTEQEGIFALTDYELATRLAFMANGTVPSEEMLDFAETVGFRNPDDRVMWLDRLLDSPDALESWWHFFAQWLKLEEIASTEKSEELHPGFRSRRQEMLSQAKNFVMTNGFGQFGSITNLLDIQFSEPEDPSHAIRRGVLALPGWLSAHAKPSMTSPIHRGVFVREQLLCTPLPPPPPEAMVTAPDPDPSLSAREQYEIHRANEACHGCHQLIDPVGLLFEHFDEVGRWRDRDNGKPIEAHGAVYGSRDLDGQYENYQGLIDELTRSEQLHECVNKQVFRYVFGRAEQESDICFIEEQSKEYREGGHRVQALLKAYVSSDAFTMTQRQVSDEP